MGERDRRGEIHPAVKSARECGLSCKWVCDTHGTKMTGQAECSLPYCAHCLTDKGKDLDRARLPDLDHESGAAYRSVWLVGRYPLPDNLNHWSGQLSQLQERWAKSVAAVNRRKATNGSVLWRSFTVYYTLNEAWIHWKFMLSEADLGDGDKAIEALCRDMEATVYDDRPFVHGELASLQLIENSRTHLLGFSPDIDGPEKIELFASHYEATKGRHVFQGMGALWELLKVLSEPEPLTCDE